MRAVLVLFLYSLLVAHSLLAPPPLYPHLAAPSSSATNVPHNIFTQIPRLPLTTPKIFIGALHSNFYLSILVDNPRKVEANARILLTHEWPSSETSC